MNIRKFVIVFVALALVTGAFSLSAAAQEKTDARSGSPSPMRA